ncbi:restriction endonuclease subunit S [Vreelandella piezotolerans]|nr:restriction endonuclease subunit S [Halomonas piezotolerans]QJA22867.1 restriction endonuclease subunit S [Halomonas piezotolerans]
MTPFKMIRTTNVRNGRIDTNDVKYADEETYLQWIRRGAPKKGDIIFTREAPVGEAGVLEHEEGVFLGQRTVMYRTDSRKADNYFVFYSLQSTFCQRQIENLSNGGTVAHVRVPDCGEIILNMPPLPEQKKIAQILSTWDQAITATERLLENSQQRKKGLMQQLLTGKKRLPGFEGEWAEARLDELFAFKKGKGLSKSAVVKNGNYKCVLYGELYTKYGEVIREVVSRCDDQDGLVSKKGDILLPSSTTTSGIDLANATAVVEDGILLGGDIIVLRPKSQHDPIFFSHLLTHIKKYEIASRAQGITIIHLYGSDLKDLVVKTPVCNAEQKAISEVMTIADSGIEALSRRLACLKQEKKALMQQLLTGKRRVQVDTEAA